MGGASAIWSTAHVLFSRADPTTGALVCQLGDVHSEEVTDEEAVFMQTPGLLSMPAPPVPGVSGPEAVYFETGGVNIVVASRNVRTASIAGLLKMGETAVFADGSQASTLYKLSGAIVQYTTHDNTATGRAISTTTSPKGFDAATPWARLTLGDLGFHVYSVRSDGSVGAYLDFGSVSGLPPPFDVMGTYATLGAQLIRIEGTTIVLGSDAGIQEAVLRGGPTFQSFMTAISSAMAALTSATTAIQTAMATITTTTPGATAALGSATAVSGAASAVTAAQTAIASAITLLPSTSTTAS